MEAERVPTSLKDLFLPPFRQSLMIAFLLLAGAYVAEHFANLYEFEYSLRPTSVYVGDLLLDNLPVINLNGLIVEGALIAILGGIWFVLSKPRYVLFSLKAVAILIAVRAFFVSLTHVGIYPGNVDPGLGLLNGIYTYLNFQTGFFFSGHTALPFLIAIIFWHNVRARIILVALTVALAVGVLLAHIHYSIDVFAAPFMAYGIFKIAQFLFPRDYALIADNTSEVITRPPLLKS